MVDDEHRTPEKPPGLFLTLPAAPPVAPAPPAPAPRVPPDPPAPLPPAPPIPRAPAPAPSRARHLWAGVTAAGAACFAWVKLWQSGIRPTVLWPDSRAYEAVAAHPLFSTGFWAGQRPPLTSLLWKLTGTPGSFAFAQTLVSVVAWGLLAYTVGCVVPPGWRRTVAVFVILGFALTTPIVMWDRSVLSETLSLSTLAALVATGIWLARRPTPVRVLALVLVAVPCALSRDTQIWTVAMLGTSFAVLVAIRAVRTHRLAVRTAVCASALLAVAGGAFALASGSGRDVANVTDVFVVRMFPYPDRVAWLGAHGMPDAAAVNRLADSVPAPRDGTAKYVNIPPAPQFSGLGPWMKRDAASTYALWLVTHPFYVVTEPLRSPRRAIDFNPDVTVYAAQDRPSAPTTPVLWPSWWWAVPVTALAALVRPPRLMRRREARFVALLALIGIPALYLAWHGDGEEVTRHTIEAYVQIRLACVILLALAVLVPTAPPRQRMGLARRRVDIVSDAYAETRVRAILAGLRRGWVDAPNVVAVARAVSLDEFKDRFRPQVAESIRQVVETPARGDLSAGEAKARRDRKALTRILGDQEVGRRRVDAFLTRVYDAIRRRSQHPK